MLAGAELILVPNDCSEMAPRLRELSVRAIENMVGSGDGQPLGQALGRSCAFSPAAFDERGRWWTTRCCLLPRRRTGYSASPSTSTLSGNTVGGGTWANTPKVSAYRHLTKKSSGKVYDERKQI